MIEIISIIVLLVIVTTLTIATIFFRTRYRNLIKVIAQLIIDKEALVHKLDETIAQASNEVNDGFIKFLSDSRQSAFDYIENIQMAVKNYLEAIESGNEVAILAARMELFSYLPEEAEAGDKNQG